MSTQAANVVSEPPQTEAPLRYTRTAMVLHWLIALLIICNAVLGLSAGLKHFGKRRLVGFAEFLGHSQRCFAVFAQEI